MGVIDFLYHNHDNYVNRRSGEVRLGERVHDARHLPYPSDVKFVLMGIKEDVGIRRNMGIGHDSDVYLEFLKSFLNIQHNDYLSGELFAVDGYFVVTKESDDAVDDLDDAVSQKIKSILSQGKIPVVIGGGHNNAYGLIKGCASHLAHPINVINLDPHADLRETGYRHSGNGFSTAIKQDYLQKYAIMGLHEAYNNQYILDRIKENENILAIKYEDIFLRKKMTFSEGVAACVKHCSSLPIGVEWDVDSMEQMLSSAMTPVGVSTQQVLEYLYATAQANALYLHIAEAVYLRSDNQKNPLVGKMLSYAVQAFVKGILEKK